MKKDRGEQKKTLTGVFRKSFQRIRDHPLLFSSQLFTTIIFITVLVTVIFIYSLQINEHLQVVIGYIESTDPQNPQAGPLGEDPLFLYQNIQGVISGLMYLALFSLVTSFFLGGASWLLAKLMVSKENITEFIKSYTVVFFAYAIPFILIFYYNLKIATETLADGGVSPLFNLFIWLILLVIAYFYFISLSLTTNSRLKEIPKKTLKNSINLKITLPIYTLSVIIIIPLLIWIDKLSKAEVFMPALGLILLLFAVISYFRVLFSASFD